MAETEETVVVCECSISNRESPLGTTGDDAGSTAATGEEGEGIWEEEDERLVGMMEISKGRSFLGSAGYNSYGHGSRLSNWGGTRGSSQWLARVGMSGVRVPKHQAAAGEGRGSRTSGTTRNSRLLRQLKWGLRGRERTLLAVQWRIVCGLSTRWPVQDAGVTKS